MLTDKRNRIQKLRQQLANVQAAHLRGEATHQAVTAARRRLDAALRPVKGDLSHALYAPQNDGASE